MAQLKLLFLDTFAHDTNEGFNLDLIQFNDVVLVKELRVIPLGAKVEINPCGARLGATNPSSFHVEAYVNNRNTKNPPTFQKIGSMEYHERNIQMIMEKSCPTDCLIVKGYYSAITLAVYGHIMKDVPPILQQPPHTVSSAVEVSVENVRASDSKLNIPLLATPNVVSVKMEPISSVPTQGDNAGSKPKAAASSSADSMNSQLYGAISAIEDTGSSAIGGVESDDPEMYSEEDVLAGDIITTDETGYDDAYEAYSFNPYQFEMTPLVMFSSPATTEYVQKLKQCDSEILNAQAERLLQLVDEYNGQPHHDKWVQAMEEVGEMLPSGLASLSCADPAAFDSSVNTLIEWTLESLDLRAAMSQPETPFKVRHLKMGVKFTSQMLLFYDELTLRLLECGVQQLLFDLFTSPHMATSLQLLIIKTLDSLTRTRPGISWFVGASIVPEYKHKTGYQQLLDIAFKNQNARVMAAVSTLLQKVHLYETLTKLAESTQALGEKTFSALHSPAAESNELNELNEYGQIEDGDIVLMVNCLEEVLSVLRHANYIIAQPAQSSLPSRKQFSISRPSADSYPGLFSLFSSCHLLEAVLVLLSSPLLSAEPDVFTAVRDLVMELLKTQSGLLYMSTNVETVNCIIRTLLQSAYDKDPEAEENSAQALGLTLVYQLQALQYVDQLKEALSQQTDSEQRVDDAELLAILHAMMALTITPHGRDALVNVLSFDLEPLLSLVGSSEESWVEGKVKTSTTVKYINDLAQMVLMYTTDISLLQAQIPRLVSLAKLEDASKVFGPMLDWLEPFQEVPILDYTNATALAKLFHSYIDQLPKIEVGLVTCLRIMTHIALPKSRPDTPGFVPEELSYRVALLELYREECLAGWTKILDKLSEKQLHSWQRGAAMPTLDRDLLLFVIQPSLVLMKSVLAQVIDAKGLNFQDTSALKPLFRTFTVICSVPVGSMDSDIVCEIHKLIIDILALYTQPQITGSEADINDAMNQSLWTSMVKMLLEFATSHPCNYLSGTLLFSELLPIPLPIQCNEPLTDAEVKVNVNYRTIWSAHLLPIVTELEFYIASLAGSSCLHLQHAFRRLCSQLADLNQHFAQFVTRSLLKSFIHTLPAPSQPETPADADASSQTDMVEKKLLTFEADIIATNMVGILSYLVQQAPAKTALISALRIKQDGLHNYASMFEKILLTLNTVSESPAHNQCQENIVSLLQSLCDVELSLIDDLDNIDIGTQLANELPDAETHEKITLAFMEHIGNYDHCYASILLSLRTLLMFTDYNYTFNCLTRGLVKDSMSLYNLFTRLNNTFSKDSSDCISTLSTALQLLRCLVEVDMSPDAQRNLVVTAKQLAQMVNWKVQPHPLDDLEKLLVDLVEESLEGIVANITSINKILKSVPTGKGSEEAEPMDADSDIMQLPSPESVQEQFSKRSIFVVCNVDMVKHSASYWLTNLMADDSNIEETDDRVQMDMLQLCEQHIKDFSLEDELKKNEAGRDNLSKVTVIHSRKNEVLALGQAGTEFKAPMRGLGVLRRGQQRGRISTRGGRDHFRDRAQNTSRPPSMHVDDFVKMTHTTNEPPPVPFQLRDRGRGTFDRGRGRTRFPSVPDGFKPNFRGGFRGSNRGLRGSPSPRGSGYFHAARGGSHRLDESPPFGGRGGSMMTGLRQDRRTFSPQSTGGRYGNDGALSDRRSHTPRSGMSDGGGMGSGRGMAPYYSSRDRNPRIASARDRDRPNHYRSYTK